MSNDPTTARAQRRQAVADGTRSDAVDRTSRRSNPRGSAAETTSRGRQQQAARDVAGDIDIQREGVGTIDRIGGGMDVFLRSSGAEQFRDTVREDFAGQADFVERDDVDPGVDPQAISAAPQVARDRRDSVAGRAREQTAAETDFVQASDLTADVGARGVSAIEIAEGRRDTVGQRAREQTAADADFVEAADLSADVTERGVTGIEIADDRRDAVGQRARQEVAADDPFAEASDFEADVGDLGVEEIGLTRQGERRRAARELDEQQPDVDITPGDLDRTEDGFEVEIERERSPSSGSSTSEPRGTSSEEPRRREERVADDLDEQFPEIDVGTDDVTRTDNGFGLDSDAQQQVAVERFDQQFDSVDVGPASVVERDGEFRVDPRVPQQAAANEFDEQFANVDIGRRDVTSTDEGFALRDDFVQDNPEILLGEQLDPTQRPERFSP